MNVFNNYLSIEGLEDLRRFFQTKGKCCIYRKNEFFVKQGELHPTAGLVLKGAFRYLANSSEGNDRIVGYSFENDFVTDYGSFQSKALSVVNVQAVNDCEVCILPLQEVNEFFYTFDHNNLRCRIAEVMLADIYDRLLSLYCDSPIERYRKLINRYPEIQNLVSLKEIASFINVTPETLSRIRRKIIHE